ncbi:hypothetical protein Csa_003458 [Cucumis sativus]|nr:hypothetical protein Csa_003458 [Cucumis sativus]
MAQCIDWIDKTNNVVRVSGVGATNSHSFDQTTLHMEQGKSKRIQLMNFMEERGVRSNYQNYLWLLEGCLTSGSLFETMRLHCRISKSGFDGEPLLIDSLVDNYFRHGDQHGAVKVFDENSNRSVFSWNKMIHVFVAQKSNFQVFCLFRRMKLISAERIFSTMNSRDGVSYNSLISGLVQQGFSDRALELFTKMQRDCLKPDCITVASLLSACASVGALHKGMQLHSHAIKAGMSADIILEGSLLDLYSKCADVETAHKFFLTTETENIVLWNVMLVAYGQLDNLSIRALRQGQQIHAQSYAAGFGADLSINNALISLYARCGRIQEAYLAFEKIGDKNNISWNSLVSGLAQSGYFEEALQIGNVFSFYRNGLVKAEKMKTWTSIQSGQENLMQLVLGSRSMVSGIVFVSSKSANASSFFLNFTDFQTLDPNVGLGSQISGLSTQLLELKSVYVINATDFPVMKRIPIFSSHQHFRFSNEINPAATGKWIHKHTSDLSSSG